VKDLTIPFDLIVVGAGINGLGIARDAAARGLRVALLEQDDICSGVSAWSGRLVHGGLRYLEHRDFALVRESLRERERLFRLAPHLVKPLRLIMPFYSHNRRPAWMIRLGMIAYDVLSFDKKTGRHQIMSTEATLRRFPGIAREGLGGAAVFTDGQVEYAERLCVEVAVAAAGNGAVRHPARNACAPGAQRGRAVDRPHLPPWRPAPAAA
jgi:glycerol-3-phosphate dehydrogenase